MRKIKAIVCAIVAVVAIVLLITDTFGAGTGTQYLYNFACMTVILPLCIYFSGIMESQHPELFCGDGQDGTR